MTLERTLKYTHDFTDQKALRSAIEEIDELLRSEVAQPSFRQVSVGVGDDDAAGEYIRDVWLELDGDGLEAEHGAISVHGKFSGHNWELKASVAFRGLHVFGTVEGSEREKVTAIVKQIQQILTRHAA